MRIPFKIDFRRFLPVLKAAPNIKKLFADGVVPDLLNYAIENLHRLEIIKSDYISSSCNGIKTPFEMVKIKKIESIEKYKDDRYEYIDSDEDDGDSTNKTI